MHNKNIHYDGHIIKYLDSKYKIDILPMGKVLRGYLEIVGWVVLKSVFFIIWTIIFINKDHLWHNITRCKRQMLYGVSDHLHDHKFNSEN